jgi:hypothetical protein
MLGTKVKMKEFFLGFILRPENRPSFEEVHSRLQEIYKGVAPNEEISEEPRATYNVSVNYENVNV